MTELLTPDFIHAIKDYYLLLDKEYPQKGIFKLTTNRYKLNKAQRVLLYRGVFSLQLAKIRKEKRTDEILGPCLHIDTYNVLFTISNYLFGRIVFLSNDGFLRDAGEIFGKIQTEKIFFRSLDLLIEYLKGKNPQAVIFYIDDPLDFSKKLSLLLKSRLKDINLTGDVKIVKSPDNELTKLKEGTISTSDSGIIDKAEIKIFDIARNLLEEKFTPEFLDFNKYINPK